MVKIKKEQAELILISGIIGAVASEILRYTLTADLNYQMDIPTFVHYFGRFLLGILFILLICLGMLSLLKNTDIIDKKEWDKK